MSTGFKFIQLILRSFMSILYEVELVGVENVPKEGAIIVCSNHLSNFDPILLGAFLPRHIYFMAKRELFRIPVVGQLMKLLGAFPVNREAVEITSIKVALQTLKEGRALGIFAQGGRETKPLKEDEGKAGVAMFAVRGSAPVLPIGVQGSFRMFTKLVVNIGKPMHFDDNQEDGKKMKSAELAVLTKEVMLEIKRLSVESVSILD